MSSQPCPHDADGNLTQDGRWTYVWDGENRLIEMRRDNASPTGAQLRLTFEYDWQGRRIRKTLYQGDGQTPPQQWTLQSDIVFLYDGWNLLAELNAEASNAKIRTYVWGNDLSGTLQGAGGVGGLLKVVNQGDSTSHFVACDGNGNVMGLVAATDGTLAARYAYGPFGEPLRASGAQAANPFRFSTKYCDVETGLYYYGYRYFNPSTGRWLSRDPIGERGGVNYYAFVHNLPSGRSDFLGWAECATCGPDVTQWFGRELANAITMLDEVEQRYNFLNELLWMKDHGLEIQYKSMNFQTQGCGTGPGCERTVWLCNKCIDRSELGNIMLGFWGSYLGVPPRILIAGVNYMGKLHPGEGADDETDTGA